MKRIVIVIVIVAVAAGAVLLGFVNPESAVGRVRYVVFRALGLVSSVAPPKPKAPGSIASARICRENLTRIQNAKRRAGDLRQNNIGNVTWEEVIAAMYPNDPRVKGNTRRVNELMPKCPDGGYYTLGTMQEMCKCSIGGQNTATIEDDHVITK
ncbi:MAG: hypothetical protein N2111_10660 [Candidatus Sumerlaeaceae bacterium]|nr:hypothetical protein [Candidatus Sumerlaeaceae bacterium]